MNTLLSFWEKNPALLYGLALFLGCLFALATPWACLPLIFLIHKKHFVAVVCLFALPCLMVYQMYTFPKSGTQVEGIYVIQSVQKTERYKGGWRYQGALKTDEGNIPCRTFSKERMSAHQAYSVKGRLKTLKGRGYALKVEGPWEVVSTRLSLADIRFEAQQYVKGYIEKQIAQPRAAHFLTGMVTGQLEDQVMQKELSQLGLSHLMAISGLHFSLIALALHLVLRLFLPSKVEAVCLMGALTLYFLFVGNTPSILRAWTMSMVFLIGLLLERRSSAINSLGVALCLSLLWNPLSALSLSFQLSFLATAGILFFYAPCAQLLSLWLPKKALKEVICKHWAWRHAYIVLSLLRDGLALTMAVHITLLPLLFSVFHTFPLSSLVYNLFFPFLAGLSLLFFLCSIVLGPWAHWLNGYYCDAILKITESPPLQLQSIDVSTMPSWLLAVLLTLILGAAVGVKVQKSRDRLGVADRPLLDHL